LIEAALIEAALIEAALIGLLARLALGAVFVLAAVTKLRDPVWPITASDFGLPIGLAFPLAYAELALGALLVAQVGVPQTAFAALALLAVFTGAAAAHVAQGHDVPCGCFGTASHKPTTWRTVARNVGLCVLALLATL
jgi:uncharacterized membrane protein YphA (DoxX/SURF4 family)